MLKTINRAGGLVAGVFLLLGGFQAAAAQDRPISIAVVDLDLVVAQSRAGKDLQNQLEQLRQQAQAEVDSMTEKANAIRQRAQDGEQSLSSDKLTELQTEYEDEMIKIRRLREQKQREAEKIRNAGLQGIEKQLAPIFDQIRDSDGYDLILNNVPGVVVMANERVDITAKVVELLNAAEAAAGAGG